MWFLLGLNAVTRFMVIKDCFLFWGQPLPRWGNDLVKGLSVKSLSIRCSWRASQTAESPRGKLTIRAGMNTCKNPAKAGVHESEQKNTDDEIKSKREAADRHHRGLLVKVKNVDVKNWKILKIYSRDMIQSTSKNGPFSKFQGSDKGGWEMCFSADGGSYGSIQLNRQFPGSGGELAFSRSKAVWVLKCSASCASSCRPAGQQSKWTRATRFWAKEGWVGGPLERWRQSSRLPFTHPDLR